MEWLTNNWVSVLVVIGVVWLVTRRGGMGCGMGHGTHTPGSAEKDEKSREIPGTVGSEKGKETGHRHGGC